MYFILGVYNLSSVDEFFKCRFKVVIIWVM